MKVLTTEKLGIKENQNDDSDTGLFLLNWFLCLTFSVLLTLTVFMVRISLNILVYRTHILIWLSEKWV